jgi:putative restriction endonuclease
VANGLALRSDLHRLYDRGYLGVDTDFRLRVSPRLGLQYGNGVDLYEREERGELIRLPARAADRPDLAALDWHMSTVFLRAG